MAATEGPNVIVGIDFGTTYSGVSWAESESKPIRLITDWPNPEALNANSEKVPSAISYDENGKTKRWGFEVMPMEESLRWFKIMLEAGPEPTEFEKGIVGIRQSNCDLLEQLGKTPEDVVADYLTVLWDYAREDIRKRLGPQKSWEHTVRVVLTVPAVWSDAAKEKTLKAARRAGLGPSIILFSEPEAAALATLREKVEAEALKVGDAFVVCDAGGGTVDLISYKVLKLDPFEVEECAIGNGDFCGSVFLDAEFAGYIKTKVGEQQYNAIRPADKRMMRRCFDMGIKRAFHWNSQKEYFVDVRGVQDNEAEGIIDETIKLTPTALRTIFDNVCGKIDPLVDKQLRRIEEMGLTTTAILLVGGFGDSRYLHNRLESSFESRGVRVLQVDQAWSSICRGATMWGQAYYQRESQRRQSASSSHSKRPTPSRLMSPMVKKRLARGSYGFSVRQDYDERIHDPRDRVEDQVSGWPKADNQMMWIIRRGDEIVEGRDPVKYTVFRRIEGLKWSGYMKKRPFTEDLYYSGSDTPSSRLDETVKKVCTVTYTINEGKLRYAGTKIKTEAYGRLHYKCDFTFVLHVDITRMEFAVLFDGKDVASVEAKYMDEAPRLDLQFSGTWK